MTFYLIRKVKFQNIQELNFSLNNDKRFYKGLFIKGLFIYYINPINFKLFKKKFYNFSKKNMKVIECNNFSKIIIYLNF